MTTSSGSWGPGSSSPRPPSRDIERRGAVISSDSRHRQAGQPTKLKFNIPEWVISGETTDVYFRRAKEILDKEGLRPLSTIEFFASRSGLLCGIREAIQLIEQAVPSHDREVFALEEGDAIEEKEVVLRIHGPYSAYGLYETPLLGILSHCTGWATAARECVEAAGEIPVISFGARHVHPMVSGRMEYAAILGGCQGCASIDGAGMWGLPPSGTIPHALILAMGDTVTAAEAFDRHMPPEVPRYVLVDTFKDEAEESLRVARALGDRLEGVRLDTPIERGRVTADLVKEVRARLDLEGFQRIKIVVSGGLDPARIRYFREKGAPVDSFGVGGYIANARPINFTADIHEVEGRPMAKRGRIPGITHNPRLKRVL